MSVASRAMLVRMNSLLSVLLLAALPHSPGPQPAEHVHVVILAGQSNMEGKVQNPLLEHQATDPATRELFAHLRDGDGWVERDDVFIRYGGRRGPLTIGYGSPGRTGVELELGMVLGEALEDPVLLIKTAWGGHSLRKNFRPPGAGLPADSVLDEDLAGARRQVEKRNEERGTQEPLPTRAEIEAQYGASYRQMMAEVRETLENLGEWFPELRGHEPRMSGFVWHQGWNDQYGGAELEYRANLEQLVRDVRADLEVPGLPFVIAVMGQNMSKPAKGPMLVIQEAQEAVPQVPDLQGTVAAVRTDVLVDEAAEALYPTWRDNFEEWQKVGSDHPYHYLGSAIWHVRMGRAFGDSLLELMGS